MSWTLEDTVALSRLGRLDSHNRIELMDRHASLSEALESVGALELGLRDEAARILDDAASHRTSIIPWHDERYPALLRSTTSPPVVLYVRGTIDLRRASIAVVGTRSCSTQYGKPATERLVEAWVEAGCSIVSGLASGIDTLAHESCVRCGGSTIAVIASGIGRITPKAARYLSDRIVEHGGAVVSEHPYHVAALPPYFPARNRIIVGLSRAVVVVESKERGGALITASFAKRVERPLWAVPGPIISSRSIGTNALILCSADEVIEDLGIAHTTRVASPLPPELEQLGADVHSVDAIAAIWQTSIADASLQLLQFELGGFVEQLPGAHYRTK